MNICTFGSSDQKGRSRCHFADTAVFTESWFLVVVCVGVPFSNGSSLLGLRPSLLGLRMFEAIAIRLEAIAIRLEAIASN